MRTQATVSEREKAARKAEAATRKTAAMAVLFKAIQETPLVRTTCTSTRINGVLVDVAGLRDLPVGAVIDDQQFTCTVRVLRCERRLIGCWPRS